MREKITALTTLHGLALTVFAFGLAYAALTAPFGVPDEFVHFWRAAEISEGHILAETRPGEGRGAALPRSADEVVEILVHYRSVGLPSPCIDREAWKRAWRMPFEPEKRSFRSFPNTASYSPVPYLPAAAALGLAWRRLPYAREAFALTALLPMTLALVGSLSIDAMSLAISFLWLALASM